MDNLILLTVSILAGFVLRRSGLFGAEGPRSLNRLIIYFFIPVVALYHIPKISLELNLIWLTITPFLIFFGSILFFQLLSRAVVMTPSTKGALMLTSGISSTSFVGFPIFELLYGPEGLAYGIILSLSGTILVFNTAGISTLFYLTSGHNSIWQIAKSILRFPPFICFVLALLLNLLSIPYTPWLDQLLGKLAAPFAVIALLSIGMQIDLQDSRTQWKYLLWGQAYKLLLAPLLTYLLVWHILDMQNLVGTICILGAAIGPMNAMSILTAEKGLNPPLAILMPTIGIPISIPILFLVDWLLTVF
ncbi:MAG: AEC family transporter [Cyanobacteria bacterium J06576_12]